MIDLKILGISLGVFSLLVGLAADYVYEAGYDDAVKDAQITQSTMIHQAQEEARLKYENQIKELVSAHDLERREYVDRMRELKKFESSGRDLATCSRERSQLARLAIRGEKLLKRAESYLKANAY